MKDFRSAFYIIGILLCIESITMLIPMIIDLAYQNSDWQETIKQHKNIYQKFSILKLIYLGYKI